MEQRLTTQRQAWIEMNAGEDIRGSRPDDDEAHAVIEQHRGVRTSSGNYRFPDGSVLEVRRQKIYASPDPPENQTNRVSLTLWAQSAPIGSGCGRPALPRVGSRSPVSPRGWPARPMPRPLGGSRRRRSWRRLRLCGARLVRGVGTRRVRSRDVGAHGVKTLARRDTEFSCCVNLEIGHGVSWGVSPGSWCCGLELVLRPAARRG